MHTQMNWTLRTSADVMLTRADPAWFIPEEESGRSYDQEKAWGVFGGPDPRLQECLLHIDVAILPPSVRVLYFTIKKC